MTTGPSSDRLATGSAGVSAAVRPVQPGDGPGCARAWLDAARYYVAMDPASFRVPAEAGLAEWFEQQHASTDPDALALVGVVDMQVAGILSAQFQPPLANSEYQLVSAVSQPRVYVDAASWSPSHTVAAVSAPL